MVTSGRAPAVGTPWWLVLLEGIAALVIGVLLLAETGATLFTLIVFVGAYWLVTGIIDLVMLFVDQSQWGWKLFSGIVGIVAGLVVLRHPWWAAVLIPATLVWLLGIIGVVIGLAALVRAFMGGGLASAAVGVISILLGALLLVHTAMSTAILITVVAIWAIAGGIMAIVAAFWLRSRQRSVGPGTGQPLAPA